MIPAPLSIRNDLRRIMAREFARYLTRDMVVYDVGCGEKPFANALAGKVKAYIGVDVADGFYDASHIDLIGSAYAVPVADGIADAVISAQVLEHLERPRDALKEAARILKPAGYLFLSVPFFYPVHAAPRDFYRYSIHGLDALLDEAGFERLDCEAIGGFWYCAGHFLALYCQAVNRGFMKKTGIGGALIWIIQVAFKGLHALEGAILRLLGKDAGRSRAMWATNYVLVARKRGTAIQGNQFE